ncbi:MAG: hypothetical protein ACYDBS_04775, partial [Acidimicrobiales bacterium]
MQQVFLAQSGPNPNLLFISYVFMLFNKYRVIAVTDRAIVVLSASISRPSFPKEVLERLPRATLLGPTSGMLWSPIGVPGQRRTWVHRRFYGDVAAADA